MTAEVQWSELQRDPRSVAERAERGAVRVHRRGEAPLLLLQEEDVTLAAEGATTAARTMRNVLHHLDSSEMADLLGETFPWTDVLPEDDRSKFVAEFTTAVVGRDGNPSTRQRRSEQPTSPRGLP